MAIFKTLKKTHAVIVEQPVPFFEKHKSGVNKGKTRRKRMIQYVEDLDTIFVDEQRKLADKVVRTPIYITRNTIKCDDNEISKIELLNAHPDNVLNGGKLFKLVEIEKEELFELKKYEEMDRAKLALMGADDNLVRAIAVWFLGQRHIHERVPKLKILLRQKLEMNLLMADGKTEFAAALNAFMQEKTHDEKLLIVLAIEKGIIRIEDGRKIAWGDSGDAMFIGSQANDVVKEMAVWVKTDEEGRETLKLIANKISNLNS
jgi:hypothetical protein